MLDCLAFFLAAIAFSSVLLQVPASVSLGQHGSAQASLSFQVLLAAKLPHAIEYLIGYLSTFFLTVCLPMFGAHFCGPACGETHRVGPSIARVLDRP